MSVDSSDGSPAAIGRNAAGWLVRNVDTVRSLPHPDEEWLSDDVGIHGSVIQRLLNNGLIERVGWEGDRYDHRGIYRTRESTWSYLQSLLGNRTEMPCGHSGFRNLRDGGFTCGKEDCDAQYDREVVESVYGGDDE